MNLTDSLFFFSFLFCWDNIVIMNLYGFNNQPGLAQSLFYNKALPVFEWDDSVQFSWQINLSAKVYTTGRFEEKTFCLASHTLFYYYMSVRVPRCISTSKKTSCTQKQHPHQPAVGRPESNKPDWTKRALLQCRTRSFDGNCIRRRLFILT